MAAASAQAAALAASGQGISSYGSLRRKASTQDTTLRSQLQAMDPNDVAVLLAETDSSGKSALHHATWRGHISNVEALLDCGADVNAWSTGTYNYGKTPIFYAITRDRDEVVELLLRRGAKTRIVNNKGQSVISLAFSHCSEATVNLIERFEAAEEGEWLNFRATHSDGELYGDLDPRFLEQPVQPGDTVHRLSVNPTTRESRMAKVEKRNARQDAERQSSPPPPADGERQAAQAQAAEPRGARSDRSAAGGSGRPATATPIPPSALDRLGQLAEALSAPYPEVAQVARATDALVEVLRHQKAAWLPEAARRIQATASGKDTAGSFSSSGIAANDLDTSAPTDSAADGGAPPPNVLSAEASALLHAAASWAHEAEEEPASALQTASEEEQLERKRVAALRGRLLRMAASPLAVLGATSSAAVEVRPPPVRLLSPHKTAAAPLELPRPYEWIDTVEGLKRVRQALEGAQYIGVDTEWALRQAVPPMEPPHGAPPGCPPRQVVPPVAEDTAVEEELSAQGGKGAAASDGSPADASGDGTPSSSQASREATPEPLPEPPPEPPEPPALQQQGIGKKSREKLVDTCRVATIQLSADHSGATFVVDALLGTKPSDQSSAGGNKQMLIGGADGSEEYAAAVQQLLRWLLDGSGSPRLVGFAFAADAELLSRWLAEPNASSTSASVEATALGDSSVPTPRELRQRVLDIQALAVSVGIGSVGGVPSLRTVCAAVLGEGMSKEEQVSDWSARPLTASQLEYAALDALACVRIREELFRECRVGQ